jgi:RHS repeat-associated protein
VTSSKTTYYPSKYYSEQYDDLASKKIKVTEYIYAGDLLVANVEYTPNAQGTLAPATQYVIADQRNSTQVVTNSTGAVTELTDYYAYGNIRQDTQTAPSTFNEQRKYIGQYADTATTGLDYLNARYYNAGYGRFTSQDSVFWGKQNLADPQSLNSYSYANNNPIRFSDPSGKYRELSFDIGFPGITFGAGFQWDSTGLNFNYSFGTGLSAKINIQPYSENGKELPHNFQSDVVIGGGGAIIKGIGLSQSGQMVDNTFVPDGDWQRSTTFGVGGGVYARKEYSLPIIGGKPTNTVPGPAYLCSPSNVIQPTQSSTLMISSPYSAGTGGNNPASSYSYSQSQISVLQQQVAILQQIVALQTQINQLKAVKR